MRSQLSTNRNEKLDTIYRAFPKHVINEEEKFMFLQHLILYTYDLEIEGAILPLIYTVIPTLLCSHKPQAVWSYLCDYWAEKSFEAGYTDKVSLLVHLKEVFPNGKGKDDALTEKREESVLPQLNDVAALPEYEYSQLLMRLFFAMSWVNNEADKEVITALIGRKYDEMFEQVRDLVTSENSSLKQGQGRHSRDFSLSIKEPLAVWKTISSKCLVVDLDIVKSVFITVFTSGKHSYSSNIRHGLATSLAIFANNIADVTNINETICETFVSNCLYGIHKWDTDLNWEQIDDVIALFAEANPDFVLNKLENALDNGSQHLDEVFKDNGRHQMWSTRQVLSNCLANIAYEPKYLDKAVAILGRLAARYPASNSKNDLVSTIAQVFLPWYPHTMAGFDEQFDALKLLHKENPTIYYEVLLQLLPNIITSSFGGKNTCWRKVVPDNWDERKVLVSDYIKSEERICELLIEYCSDNPNAIIGIVENISDIMEGVFDKAIDVIRNASSVICVDQKLKVWHILDNEISRHKYFRDADWSMNEKSVEKLIEVNKLYAPDDIVEQSLRLFGWDAYAGDFVYKEESYYEHEAALNELRIEKINQIFASDGIYGVKKLIFKAENKMAISKSCAEANVQIDNESVRDMLTSDSPDIVSFISYYIQLKMSMFGFDWAKGINIVKWNAEEKSCFFSTLPFSSTYWHWAESELKEHSGKYWSKLWRCRFVDESEHDYAVERLIEYDNINAAIECLWVEAYSKRKPDAALIVKTLGKASKVKRVDSHHISILIGYLQSRAEVDFEILASLEYSFYEKLMDHYAKPITLERKIALQPDYFIQLVKVRYSLYPHDKMKNDEFEKIWHILYNWRTVPGVDETGNFNESKFASWITDVQVKACIEGIADEVNRLIGGVLIHSPKKENGLPINPIVEFIEATPNALNGFRLGLCNSRGVHGCSVGEELELADMYRKLRETAKVAGYRRLSEMYGNLEKEHREDAKQYAWEVV